MAFVEEEAVQRAVAGDQEALVELLEHYTPAIRRNLAGQIDPRWQSVLSEDDVLQETYTDVFLGIARFVPQGEGSFQRWVLRLARNNLLDAIKGLKSLKKGGGEARRIGQTPGDSCLNLLEEVGGSITSPSLDAARNEAHGLLSQAIEQLSPVDALIVRLYDLEGYPVDEVATILECSRGAVFMRRSRALNRLRDVLESPGF